MIGTASPFGRAYALLVTAASYLQSLALLALRLVFGFQFAESGWGKFFGKGIPAVAEYFAENGIPLPYASAVLASTTELAGGVLLMLGLATRLTALPLIFTMLVALVSTEWAAITGVFPHTADGQFTWGDWSTFFNTAPLPLLVGTLALLAFGPGRVSVDYLLGRAFARRQRLPA